MRNTMFGDVVIESTSDDLGAHVDLDGAYAIVAEDSETGKFRFEILDNVDGEERASSDSIFDDLDAVDDYLFGWLTPSDVQRQD